MGGPRRRPVVKLCHSLRSKESKVHRTIVPGWPATRKLSGNSAPEPKSVRKSTLSLFPLPEPVPIWREMLAIRPVRFLPSGGRLERRNWHLRSPIGTPSRSVRATNATDNVEPTHGARLPLIAEMLHAHL